MRSSSERLRVGGAEGSRSEPKGGFTRPSYTRRAFAVPGQRDGGWPSRGAPGALAAARPYGPGGRLWGRRALTGDRGQLGLDPVVGGVLGEAQLVLVAGLLGEFEVPIHIAQVLVDHRVAVGQDDCALQLVSGLLEPAEPVVDPAEGVDVGAVVGLLLQRAEDQPL